MGYTAKIRAKGLDATGVTEDLAKRMHATVGATTTLAIVELNHAERGDLGNGDHWVALTLELVEPSTSDRVDDLLRELMRALYRDRAAKAGDAIPGVDDGGRSLDDVLTEGRSLVERDDDDEPTGVWDGSTDAPGDEVPAKPDEEWTDAEVTHAFMPGTTDASKCAIDGCGKTKRAKIHQGDDA